MSTTDDIKGKAEAPVPFFRLEIIRKRADFKAANGGGRFATAGFTLLRAPQAPGPGVRFGFTTTKKLGKAVLRNRIRRRLREAARAALRTEQAALAGKSVDFVVLARGAAADLPFETLCADLARAVSGLLKRPEGGEKRPHAKAKLGKTPPLP